MNIPDIFKPINTCDKNGFPLYFCEPAGMMCVLKKLDYFDLNVFHFLKTHTNKNVPRVLHYIPEGETLYVFEEFVDGVTLEEYLTGNISADEKLRIIYEICDGLMFLHSAPMPIIHRDLKGSNIMVTNLGSVKIIDYDAAKTFKVGESHDTYFMGTAGSAAPEQFGFAQSDPRTDVYGVGKLISKMFKNEDSKWKWLLRVSKRATSMDPADRFQNVSQLKSTIQRHGRSKGLFPPPGFRTGNPVNIVIACLGYSTLLYLLQLFYKDIGELHRSDALILAYDVEVTVFFLLVIDIFTDWTGLFSKLPLMRKGTWLERLPGMILYTILLSSMMGSVSALMRLLFA